GKRRSANGAAVGPATGDQLAAVDLHWRNAATRGDHHTVAGGPRHSEELTTLRRRDAHAPGVDDDDAVVYGMKRERPAGGRLARAVVDSLEPEVQRAERQRRAIEPERSRDVDDPLAAERRAKGDADLALVVAVRLRHVEAVRAPEVVVQQHVGIGTE